MSYLDEIKSTQTTEKTVVKTETKQKSAKTSIFSFLAVHGAKLALGILIIFSMLVIFVSSYSFDNGFSFDEINATAIILAVLIVVIYMNGYPIGMQACENSEDVKKTQKEFDQQIDEIARQRIEYKIYDFCPEHVAEELRLARLDVLTKNNLTLEDFENWLDNNLDKTVNEGQLKALEKAKAIKPFKLSKEMIYNQTDHSRRKGFISSNKGVVAYRYGNLFIKIITTFVSVLFSFQLTGSIVVEMTPETLVVAGLQFVLIAMTIFSSITHGWNEVKKRNKRTKERIAVLNSFFAWEQKTKQRYQNNDL